MEKVLAQVDIKDVFAPAKSFNTFGDLVNVIIRNAFVFAGVIAFILLVGAGFSIIVSAGSGDSKKMEQGKKAMTGAVLGLIIVVTSVWLVEIIEKVTGLKLLSP